jgi:hypothetical protein
MPSLHIIKAVMAVYITMYKQLMEYCTKLRNVSDPCGA